MQTSDFDYELDESFIASDPVVPRDSSKLMLVDCTANVVSHRRFYDIKDYLRAGDLLVVNRSKVIPARMLFDINGRESEIFLLRQLGPATYNVMVRPGKFFAKGSFYELASDLSVQVLELLDDGTRIVKFISNDLEKSLNLHGSTPLPPYIKGSTADAMQYQTVYAQEEGSVAAPTAGLHFTEKLLSELRAMGVEIVEVVLHVGRGTFLPVKTESIADHKMHSEFYVLSEEASASLNRAIDEKRRIIAVGTTSVRVLESAYSESSGFSPGSSETDIFIYPGKYRWKVVDGLISNFHLPKSTLIMLVASFLESKGVSEPVNRILDLYELAKTHNYRFYSFGDAMFIY